MEGAERNWDVPLVRAIATSFISNANPFATANLPDDCISPLSSVAKTGVCYGYAQVVPPPEHAADFEPEDIKVLPMVMSLGWNPFYKNERLSAVNGTSYDSVLPFFFESTLVRRYISYTTFNLISTAMR